MNEKSLILIVLAVLLISSLAYKLTKVGSYASPPVPLLKTVNVSVSIGEFGFKLYGYSSPGALVSIEGPGMFEETYARKDGYFEFTHGLSPLIPQEACLTARDQLGRLSVPVCIPPFSTEQNVVIGPILMPPTISLDKKNYLIGDQVILTGQTIPNTQVKLSTFTNAENVLSSILTFSLIKPVEAITIPQLDISSDHNGNYSVALPSASSNIYRVFAQTDFLQSFSPKSLTLQLEVLPVWMIIFNILGLLFRALFSRLLEIVVLVEIFSMVIYFLRRYLHPHVISQNKAIIVRENLLPAVELNGLVKAEMSLLRQYD